MMQRLRRWWPAVVGCGLTCAFLALYLHTLARDLLPADNGEFQLVAAQLGLAHPPGFPLYTLLAHAVTRLPGSASPAVQANALSAFTSAAAVLLVYVSVYRLTRQWAAALVAALALGTATTFWVQATVANIRSLTAGLTALIFLALIGAETSADSRAIERRWQPLLGLALGLGLSHHLSLAFIGAVSGVYVVWRWGWRAGRRLLPYAAPGLLPLLYLPWRDPALRQPAALLHYALGLGFEGDFFYFRQPAVVWERLQVMGQVIHFQFIWPLLLLAGLGWLRLGRQHLPLALLFSVALALHTLVTATYRAPQSVEYMLPAYLPIAMLIGLSVGSAEGATGGRYRGWRAAGASLIMVIGLAAGVWQGVQRYPSLRYLAHNDDTRRYAEELLQAVPADSEILSNWHWVTPLRYLQQVEEQRPDVTVTYVFPRGEPYADTWASQTATALNAGRPTATTHFYAETYAALPPPEPLGEAFLFLPEPRRRLPTGFTPWQLNLGPLNLVGYQLSAADVAVGERLTLTLAWYATESASAGNLFAHLVGADGQLYAQADRPAPLGSAGLTLTALSLTPRPGAAPGTYQLLVGAYSSDGNAWPAADGATRSPVTTLHISPSAWPPITRHPRRWVVAADRTLVGYDWDLTLPDHPRLYLHWRTDEGYYSEIRDLAETEVAGRSLRAADCRRPCHYVPFGEGLVWLGGTFDALSGAPGDAITVRLHWGSVRPVLRDVAVSAALIGLAEDGYHWAWQYLDNGIPALGAIPTLKWIAGSRITDLRQLRLDPQTPAGQQVMATLQLYDAFTNQPLPILDERLAQQAPWVPLGRIEVTP